MDPISAALGIGNRLIDHFWPKSESEAENNKRKAELFALAQQGELKELEISMSAIIAESSSKDKWTSRARPTFMYLFYILIVFLVIIFPMVGIWYNREMITFYENVSAGFQAIPEPMWWTFTTGYLGYTGARTFEKNKGVAK